MGIVGPGDVTRQPDDMTILPVPEKGTGKTSDQIINDRLLSMKEKLDILKSRGDLDGAKKLLEREGYPKESLEGLKLSELTPAEIKERLDKIKEESGDIGKRPIERPFGM